MLRCTGLSHEILRRMQRGCTTTRVLTRHTALGSACVWRVSRARSLRVEIIGGRTRSPRGPRGGVSPRTTFRPRTSGLYRLCGASLRGASPSGFYKYGFVY